MRRSIAVSLLAASLAGATQAQSWQQLIAQQWPGHAIQKVSEKEFEAFGAAHFGRLDKGAGYESFLTAQYRAYGLPTNSPYPKQFLVPTSNARRPADGFGDGNVPEGPEPNGDPNAGGTPTAFGCGDQGEGAVNVGGDADWWSFTLSAPSQILAYTSEGLSGPGLPGALTDTVLELYDASSTLIAVNDDFTVQSTSQYDRSLFSLLQLDLGPGTYYLSAKAFSASSVGNYTLDLQCSAPGQFVVEGPEPNGDPNSGGTPTVIGLDMVGDGDITLNGDTDWWVMNVTFQTSVLAVMGPGGLTGSGVGDSTLSLFDSAFNRLATDDDGGPGYYSQIVITLTPGTYYFETAAYQALTGTYRLYVYSLPAPPLTTPEGPEPNGDPSAGGTPTPLLCIFTGLGDIGIGGAPPAGDADWWSFTINTAAFVQGITLPSHITGLPCPDTELWLRDAAGTQLAYDDDGGIGLYSEIAMYLDAGTYFFDVQGYGVNDIGGYELHLDCGVGGVATFQAFSGGCPGTNGTPTVQTRTGEVPLLGTTYTIDYVNLPPTAAVLTYAGFSNTMSTQGQPLPFDLGPLGAPGCQVEVDPFSILLLLADSFGAAKLHLQIPLTQTLSGFLFYNQGLVFDAGANNLGLTATNSGVTIVGHRL